MPVIAFYLSRRYLPAVHARGILGSRSYGWDKMLNVAYDANTEALVSFYPDSEYARRAGELLQRLPSEKPEKKD